MTARGSGSARKSGLGRGLDALIAGEPANATAGQAISVAIALLRPNRLQPRTEFDADDLHALAESISVQGVIQPILAVDNRDGSFTIVAGERRWRAAREAGLTEVPVLLREVRNDQELLEVALVENLQRADLNAIEEAEAYSVLRERFDLSQQEIAARVGKSRSAVANTLRLLKLPLPVLQLLRDGRLSAGQARPLLALGDPEHQARVAERTVADGLSARQVEALADGATKTASRARKPASLDVHTRVAQERLTRALQTKVEIRRIGDRGTVRVHFHSEEELMRIFDAMLKKGGG